MPLANRCGGGGSSFTAIIKVTYNEGATCTCSKGSKTLTAPDTSGTAYFKVTSAGTYLITVSKDTHINSKNAVITNDGESVEVTVYSYNIFGISRSINNSSPAWARTDQSIGLSATASVGTVAGSSDFDNYYPWNQIARETLSTGDVMVKIPRFWYRRYRSSNIEYIQIADEEITGFSLHPAFNHANTPKDCIYVGAYETSSNKLSLSGKTVQNSKTLATFRTQARTKGSGWNILDVSTLSAIQMLILVEYANNNVQTAIGRGNCDRSSSEFIKTGTCDSVPNLTGIPTGTNGETGVVWRGIENFWGNIQTLIDGAAWSFNDERYYVCNDPDKYTSTDVDTNDNYTQISYKGEQSFLNGYYFRRVGLDAANAHVMFPEGATTTNGSGSTFCCDTCALGATLDAVFASGGGSTDKDGAGLFGLWSFSASSSSTEASEFNGSRLIYIPQ